MSETSITPPDPSSELGYTTRTDVGGQTGTQGDATPGGQPVAAPSPVTPTEPTPEAANATPSGDATTEAGKPLGESAPKLDTLQNQLCPNCHTGVLVVTRYDPYALHEQNQGAALIAGKESGGAYDVLCLNCDYTESRAFNPGSLWGK